MKVVLLDNIKGVGQVGDVRDVSDGYARNFLFPRSRGKPATQHAIADAEALRAKRLIATELEHKQAELISEKISGITVELHGKANEKGTLFSGISPAEIAVGVSEIAGVLIPESAVISDAHLKHTGVHSVELRLSEKVTSTVLVDVRPL